MHLDDGYDRNGANSARVDRKLELSAPNSRQVGYEGGLQLWDVHVDPGN